MNALRELLEKKRKASQEEFGDRKFVKRSEIEANKLKKLKEEEEAEQQAKAAKNKAREEGKGQQRHHLGRSASIHAEAEELSREEVIRRLRLMKEPITLFGEDDAGRRARLRAALESHVVQDEHAGGGPQNDLLKLRREARNAPARPASGPAAAAEEKRKVADKAASDAAAAKPAPRKADGQAEGGEAAGQEEDDVMAAFQRAAAALAQAQADEARPVEDRIIKSISGWCEEWGQDLDRRPQDVKDSAPGHHATVLYQQTMGYFKPMLRQLKRRAVAPDMLAGVWMIVTAIRERNYLHAYDIYMRLAIGNAPWPIGVTSVGIHERSSREKISHVMNVGGAAHIMNDEATRKYLQAIKRLLTFMQRAHPTDPSRSVDFDAFKDAGRGAIGSGSDKLALLEAEEKGQGWRDLGLSQAPHFLEADGSVRVPQRWKDMVADTMTSAGIATGTTPPRTPPPTPPQDK